KLRLRSQKEPQRENDHERKGVRPRPGVKTGARHPELEPACAPSQPPPRERRVENLDVRRGGAHSPTLRPRWRRSAGIWARLCASTGPPCCGRGDIRPEALRVFSTCSNLG